MFEYVAYLAAQQQTVDHAHEALSDAPVRTDRFMAPAVIQPRMIRQRVSIALHRLADRIEPAPECAAPALGPC